MAQELEQILELLREIRRANNTNDESTNRLLTSMSDKIDTLDRNSLSADLIKSYMQDITRNLDSKYQTTSEKFSDIENALKKIFNGHDDYAKTKDLKELYDIFSQGLNNFYVETRQQRSVIASVESKLSEISANSADKTEMARTVSLIRNDFETLNQTYRSSIDSLSLDLKNVISNLLSLDQTSANAEVQAQISEMYRAVSDIISFLKSMDKREEALENILKSTASAESLKLTQVAVDSIMTKTDEISVKLEELYDANASKDQFNDLSEKVEDLSKNADGVKKALAGITKDIDALPDVKVLESSIQTVYNKIKEIHEDLLATHVKGDVRELDTQINTFASELATAKKIIIDLNDAVTNKLMTSIEEISFEQESYEIKNDISKMLAMLPQKDDVDRLLENDELNKSTMQSLLDKVDGVADMLDNLPKQNDIADLNSNQLSLVENLQGVASKEDVDSVSDKIDDIEQMIDKLNFDEEFQSIYDKTSTIENWLEKSNVKENTEQILSKVEDKAEQKEVLSILKTTEEIVNNIEELSKNVDVKKVNRTVSEVYQLIEDLKNDFINTAEMHNDSVIVHLSELQKSIEYVLTGEEFENFVQDLKNFVDKVGEEINNSSTNFDEIYNYQKSILNKISEINVSAIEDAIAKQVSPIDEKLTSLSEYVESMKVADPEFVKSEISEIKEILSNKRSNVNEVENLRKDTISTIEKYLQEIKVLLDTSSSSQDEDLQFKIAGIEEIINGYHAENENNLTNIILKLDDIKYLVDSTQENRKKDLRAAIGEISEISASLKDVIGDLDKTSVSDGSVTGFVSKNLSDIKSSIEQLTSEFESNMQAGFSYNTELIEEKTSVLLDFIKDIKLGSEGSSDLYERFAIADDKLSDIQQTLLWINSDVINHANSQSEMLLKELMPLKDMMLGLSDSIKNRKDEELKSAFDTLHSDIADELNEVTKYSRSTFDKLEEQYEKVHNALCSTESNLRDFFLGDIDSVIIKIDNLKEDIDEALGNVSLPDAKQMKEFKSFLENMENFKEMQKEAAEETAKVIQESLGSQLAQQHEELKSILSVAANNEQIINAIEDLKQTFKSKIKDFEKNEDSIFDDIDSASLDENVNGKLVEELKSDFEKCTKLIKGLSDDNPELAEVLSAIKDKMDNISVSAVDDGGLQEVSLSEDEEVDIDSAFDNLKLNSEKTLVGTDNFDFIKAFDILQADISKLNENVSKIVPNGLVTLPEIKSQASAGSSVSPEMFSELNSKIDELITAVHPTNWLDEIKTYTLGSDVNKLLDSINTKIDLLMKSGSTEIANEVKDVLGQVSSVGNEVSSNAEIKSMLTAINSKIDALTSSSDTSALEELKDAIGNITPKEDVESAKLLSAISSKIDVIASVDNADDFDEIRDTLDSIEGKISENADVDNLHKKLDVLEAKVDALASTGQSDDIDDIKDALTTIEDKLSEGVDVSDINKKLDSLDAKVDVLAMSDTPANIDDIKYAIQGVDEKIDLMSRLSDSDDAITSMLEDLNSKIDELMQPATKTSDAESLSEIKELIVAQSDYIEQLEKNDKTEAYKKVLEEINANFESLSASDGSAGVQKTLKEMKESIMAAVVTVFDQVSFVEESEEIKDFVEEKTDEINKNLAMVTDQLKQITNSAEEPDYTYSMQDIESDLAKMRIALSELKNDDKEDQAERLSSILDNIARIGSSVEDLHNSISANDNLELKTQFDSVEDISKTVSVKMDKVTKLLEKSNASDKVMRQALIYMGEWIDAASASMNMISENSSEISNVKDAIAELKSELPQQTELLNSLGEKFDEQQERLAYFEKHINKISSIEERFEEQQERIDRLELALEKILSAVEDIDDSKVSRKIDKIDKQLLKLSTNVEKLASYVD